MTTTGTEIERAADAIATRTDDGARPFLLPYGELYAQAQAAPNTQRTYRSALRSFALFAHAQLGRAPTVDVVGPTELIAFKAYLEEADPQTGERRCAPSTVAKQMSALRGFARWLALDQSVDVCVDPRIQQIRVAQAEPGLPRPLTRQQLERLVAMPDLSTMRGRRDRAILEVLSRAGLRRSEAAALRCDEIVRIARWNSSSVRGAVVDTAADETEWAVHVAHSKRGRSRDVPLARSVVRALAAWQGTSVAQHVQRGPGRPHVFVSVPRARGQTPRPLSTAAIGRIVARYAAAAGIPEDRRTPHALRHTFCTAVAARAGVDEVKRLAGHADIRTSMKYVEVSDERAAEAIAATFNVGEFASGGPSRRRGLR